MASPISPIEPRFQRLAAKVIIDLRSGSERRIHADRRKVQRVGDVADRRQHQDRRSN